MEICIPNELVPYICISDKKIVLKKELPDTLKETFDEFNKKFEKITDLNNIEFKFNHHSFFSWIESSSDIYELMENIEKAVMIAINDGFEVTSIYVGDGVHEHDSGYEAFTNRTYQTYDEFKNNIVTDFENEEKRVLDRMNYTTLNFEKVIVDFIYKNSKLSIIFFSKRMCFYTTSKESEFIQKETDLIEKYKDIWPYKCIL